MPPATLIASAVAGFLSALLVVSALTGTVGGVILANLAPLPLFALVLGWGINAGAAAGAIAGAAAYAIGGAPVAATFLALHVVPAIGLSWVALHRFTAPDGYHDWPDGGRLAIALCGLGAVMVAFGAVMLSEQAAPEAFLSQQFTETLRQMSGDAPVDGAASAQIGFIADLLARLPALIAVSWLAMLAANAMLAQAVLTRFDRQIRPTPSMAEITLPPWFSVLALVLGVGALALGGWAGFVLSNLLLVQSIALVFAGLAVLHTASFRWRNRLIYLVAFYFTALVFEWPFVMAALVGIAEPWARLRMRLSGPRTGTDLRE